MDLKELYETIGGDYDQAVRVLRMDKLIDKHIRKLTKNGVVEQLIEAGRDMEPTRMFESAHAMKGVCANLGLVGLASAASDIAEEFRPGNARTMSDADVAEKVRQIEALYKRTSDGIAAYENA